MKISSLVLIIFSVSSMVSCGPAVPDGASISEQSAASSPIQIAGAMRNVMHQGQLAGVIDLDTIQNKSSLYGLGPVEYLRGELLIANGHSYISKVAGDSGMTVVESFQVKAPFFVYANQSDWDSIVLPLDILTLDHLESYLKAQPISIGRPFVFRLSGRINQGDIHLQNLPPGTKVSSPAEAHQGQVNYRLEDQDVEIIGFYSTDHHGVFTHHDTNMHLHLITNDRQQMGHLDSLEIDPGEIQLFLPSG